MANASRRAEFEIEVPPDVEGGVYTNFFNAWHSERELTIDFASRQIPSYSS